MNLDTTGNVPIFNQIASSIEDSILIGVYPEESRIPSTTEISTSLRINPATVLKGVTLLVDEKIIYKKRGIGMFVSTGAVEKIKEKRRELFYESYIKTLVSESLKLGLHAKDILEMVKRGFENE